MGLAFRWNRVALVAAGQDENLVPHPLEHAYPLFGFERNAVDVPNPTNDHSDVHWVLTPAPESALSRTQALDTDRPGGAQRKCVASLRSSPDAPRGPFSQKNRRGRLPDAEARGGRWPKRCCLPALAMLQTANARQRHDSRVL